MAIQQLDSEKLEGLKTDLESIKSTMDEKIASIGADFLHIVGYGYWQGLKADAYIDSFKRYWYSDEGTQGQTVHGTVINDFDNMIKFIHDAIASTTQTDNASADNIEEQGGVVVTPPSSTATPENEGTAGASGNIDESSSDVIPNANEPVSGSPISVSVGGFEPHENNNENINVAGLDYQILDENGNPARDNIAIETITIGGNNHQVYTYDDPATEEREHYIIGAFIEDGKNSRPTGDVYTIDYGNGDVYEFVDLDTNARTLTSNEITPDDAMDTYVDILSVRGQSYTNIGEEGSKPVTVTKTGKTISGE